MGALLGMLAGGAIQAGLGALNNMQSHYYTTENMQLGAELNEEAAKNADLRTRALYKDFYSPEALVKQYKAAGLSPSLMFGGTPGQGGTAGAQGGTNALGTPYTPISLLEGAQIENIQAQTEKTKAETKSIEGKREAEIAEIWAEAGYKKAAAALSTAQKNGQELNNYITTETTDFSINTARALAEQAANSALQGTFEIMKAQAEAQVAEATINAQIETAIKNVQLLDTEILLKKAEKNLTEAKINEINAQITTWQEQVKQGWKDIYTRMKNASTDRYKTYIYEEYVMRSMNSLEKDVFNKYDLKERELMWTIVDGTFNNMLEAVNTAANPGKKH